MQAVIEKPIAAEKGDLSAPEIATLLQTLPNRHAVVAIGARVTSMETVDLAHRGDRVPEAEATQREQRIKEMTFARYDLQGQPEQAQRRGTPDTREEPQPPRAAQSEAEAETQGEALPPEPPLLPRSQPSNQITHQTFPRVAKRKRETPPPPPESLETQHQAWQPYDEV